MNKKTLTEKKTSGRVYTPKYIVKNILDLSGYSGASILNKHVMENSCGDGAFLCEIVLRYCEEAIKAGFSAEKISQDMEKYIHGIEIELSEWDKCINNVSQTAASFGLKGIKWDIICADALQIDSYNGKMDYVIGNPPYVRVHNLGSSFDEIKRFSFSQGGMTDLFIVFYEIGLKMLNENGVLGYITPNSFYNSLAGSYMRNILTAENLIDKIADLKHYQAFNATTYTTIAVLKKNKTEKTVDFYQYDEQGLKPYFVERLHAEDFYIAHNFYFSNKNNLSLLNKIFLNLGQSDILVKNGYATLCDNVFVGKFTFDSEHVIPVVKASKGVIQKIIFPYDEHSRLISEENLMQDKCLYEYLLSQKEKLVARSNEKDPNKYWYAYGRSQAINDTFKNKLAINNLIRNSDDLKFVDAPTGTGVYGGLYIFSETVSYEEIKKALSSDEFVSYISLLGKYKNGGYYTYSSKDVKRFLDYKFSYTGGCYAE